jgi:hypothetical protein
MRKRLSVALAVLAFATGALAQSSDAVPGSGKTVGGVPTEAVGVRESAKVTSIDAKSHTVTLQSPNGIKQTYPVSQQFDFKRAKVGDSAVVVAVDAIAIALKGPKSGPPGAVESEVVTGDKTDVGVTDTVRVAAKIKAIDTKKPSVTLEGPTGGTLQVKAKSAQDLKGLKVGDDLDVTYTHAVVVDLVPSATK